jgi:hypothetical protein
VKRWDYLILVSKEAFDFNSTVSTLGFNFALLETKGESQCVPMNPQGWNQIKIAYPMGTRNQWKTTVGIHKGDLLMQKQKSLGGFTV